MNRLRMAVGGAGILLIVAALAWAGTGLAGFGHYDHEYGKVVARSAVPQRSAQNSVVATAFDYRGFDTLGEEFILFIASVGVVVLLRQLRREGEHEQGGERELKAEDVRSSTAERWLGAISVAPVGVLSGYVIVHGQLSPGGGFQGGVVLMAAAAFLALGGESALLLHLRRSSTPIEMAEAAGAAAFAMIGFGGLLAGSAFFYNFIAYGKSGLLTGGMIPLANIAVGVEVAGALLMVTSELFDQRLRSGADEE